MILTRSNNGDIIEKRSSRSRSAQGPSVLSPAMKIPMPPRLWITDVSDESANDSESVKDEQHIGKPRLRSRYRHHKVKSNANVPIGIFWDIENCQVPRGCSAIDVVSAIRAKFLMGRREADFVVVCDVRKESTLRLQELNDAQVSLIHVCGTQKNAADEKLRQCMRRYGELHSAPAALLLISGDINFAADLSDFRHRKNMDVILVHKQNTSTALIACATSHYCYNELTAHLPRNSKVTNSQSEEEEPTCEMEVTNLPPDQAPERVSRRLRRLADNCGGKVMKVQAHTATLKFPTPDHASRALKRMDGEDVFGNKIGTRYLRNGGLPFNTYSSDEGYSTGSQPNFLRSSLAQVQSTPTIGIEIPPPTSANTGLNGLNSEWALALQQLPVPPTAEGAVGRQFAVAIQQQQVKPRKIRGTHGSSNTELSGCSSNNSGDDFRISKRDVSVNGAQSPWNSSASFSEQSSEGDISEPSAELTVTNLPSFDPKTLQEMLTQLFSQYVSVVRASVWMACEGPIGTVTFRTENDARLAIARVHKRKLDNQWMGRRLELSLGKPSPAPNLEVLRARLRAILLEQPKQTLPLLRLRDAYASRYCCALTTSDIAKVRETVIIHESFGRLVQLIDLSPVSNAEMLEAPWRCHMHAAIGVAQEDGSRILMPVLMEVAVLANNVQLLLEKHEGILPLLSFVECYEATFPKLIVDTNNGVALELLLRSVPGIVIRDKPSRHITTGMDRGNTPSPASHISEGERKSAIPRTAPALEPMLALFERELIDLLRTSTRCTIPFSKLIPAFHHHFGRQCRVADYGFTKLPDLLAALSNTVVVLGSGSMRVITLSAAAQSRRWTTDLVKVLRSQPGRAVHIQEIPVLYQTLFTNPFSTVDYGVCTMHELMARVTPQTVIFGQDGSLSLPRRTPTNEEKGRTVQFAIQAIELLCHTPNLRMEFSKFVPEYHAHFGRQLRVAHYGCVKLVELFELIPESMRVCNGLAGEREVRLALLPARTVLGQRLKFLSNVPIANFVNAYAAQFGANPLPDMLDVLSVESLVFAAGGAIEEGLVKAPGEAPRAVTICLSAVAALSGDRSVRGSTDDYFTSAFRDIFGQYPDIQLLCEAQVISRINRRVLLNPAWRAVWRLAQVLAAKQQPMACQEMEAEYVKRFEPTFPCKDLGFDSLLSFVRNFPEAFQEDGLQRFGVCAGVVVPQGLDHTHASEDFSIFDTPPGQKGSRVFESPMTNNIWYSPPASALPVPSDLLSQDKRRTRLAAQFTEF